jgi:putative ABC transport system permease protein
VSVSGVIETGAEEDRALVVPLSDALALTGGRVTEFLVRADTARLEQVASAIEAADPSAQARTVRQVAEAERSLLDKVRQLLLIVTICVALVSAIAVANTLSIIVLERVEEIGLLKAMGATHGLVVAYFALEEGAVALVGGLLGLLAGIAVAETISASVFGATIPVPALAWPVPFAVAVAIALLAGALPVWRAAGIDAASTLKGL